MRKTRLLSILALLLMAATGAWAQDYYAPSADEVIILKDVYNASNSGYSSHSAIAWGGTASTSSKKPGDPNNGGQPTEDRVSCYSVSGDDQGTNITLSITGVSKVIVYHERSNTNYIELRDGSKEGNIIGSGQKNTYYTEVALTATNKYSIFLHGTDGEDDQDFYVYAIKLIAAPAPATVAVTGVTLDKTTASMTVGGETLTLTATVAPENATDQTVTWTTSDASVATVANGVVTAMAAGTATITATATNGTDDTSDDKTATCAVTVAPAATGYTVTLAEGTEDAANWTIEPNAGLNGGETVTITYNGTKRIQSITAVKKAAAPTYTLLSAATMEDIGKVVCAAGHLHDAKTAVPTGCTAVGILGVVTDTGHGLILALQDATSQEWNAINGWTSVTSYAGTTLKELPDDAARGNLTSYTALGETTVSNWAVAQKSDYEAIFTNLGSTTDNNGKTCDGNVNAYITTGVGGTAITYGCWSATEYEDNEGWYFYSEYWSQESKDESNHVRPVLGF